MDLGWETVSPSVDFTDASTTFLADDPAMWPESFIIAGLTYERFERPQGAPARQVWDQAARCAWLSRQTREASKCCASSGHSAASGVGAAGCRAAAGTAVASNSSGSAPMKAQARKTPDRANPISPRSPSDAL